MIRGRGLELAVARAARDYRRQGRAALIRQHPQVGGDGQGLLVYVGQAPIDFLGTHRGADGIARCLVVECKETRAASYPIDKLRSDQRAALGVFHTLGAEVLVLVELVELAEVYALSWPVLDAFLRAPWRASLSVHWLRAHGLLVPETERGHASRRRTLFLDGRPHPERDIAGLAVTAEKAKARASPAPPLVLEPTGPPQRRSAIPGMTPYERQQHIAGLVREGIEHVAKRQRWRKRR